MSRIWVVVGVGLLLAVTFAPAAAGQVGSCPDGFELHPVDHHDGEGDHHHVGTDVDRNGDGLICGKHVSVDGSVHVHIDNHAGE